MKEQKDVRQRIEEGEFAQSAEISASYLDEDILIIDNVAFFVCFWNAFSVFVD